MSRIVIVDYGMGNLRSVQKALERVGHPEAVISSDPNRIAEAAKIVLPGVGALGVATAQVSDRMPAGQAQHQMQRPQALAGRRRIGHIAVHNDCVH